MTLTDPNSGLPYAFGAVFPSSHASAIANQLPRAIDGGAGGSGGGGLYEPAAKIQIGGAGLEFMDLPLLFTRSVTRSQPLVANLRDTKWAPWTSAGAWQNTDFSASFLDVPLTRLIHGARLDIVRLRYRGKVATRGALPQFMPYFALVEVNNEGTENTIGTYTDASATVPVYEGWHNISAVMAHTIDLDNYTYWLHVHCETGTGALADAVVASCRADMTVTSLPEG